MFVKGLRKFLYAGALLALAPIMARADEPKKAEAIPAPGPASPCPPATCKVKVCEWVDEPCEYTRHVYKPVTKQETYTAYKYETVQEQKTKQVTEYKRVCETVMETRCVTKRVPCWEEKTVMETRCKVERYTEMVSRTKLCSHWECVEVPTLGSLFGGHKGGCGNACGNPCGDPCANACSAPCTRTVRKLKVDCVTECVPVCKTRIVKECVPVCKKVCTYKCVTENVTCPVTKVRCVPECKTVTYTECKKVCVPYQATRCVTTCECVAEVVKGTKKVARWVEKEVPVAPCADACATTCCNEGFFSKLRGKFASFGKCSTGCGAGCGVASSCSSCGH